MLKGNKRPLLWPNLNNPWVLKTSEFFKKTLSFEKNLSLKKSEFWRHLTFFKKNPEFWKKSEFWNHLTFLKKPWVLKKIWVKKNLEFLKNGLSFKKMFYNQKKNWALTKETIIGMKIKPQTWNDKFYHSNFLK